MTIVLADSTCDSRWWAAICYWVLGLAISGRVCAVRGPDDPFSCMESTISCTGSYDAIGILVMPHKSGWCIWVCWDVHHVDFGQATIQGILCE